MAATAADASEPATYPSVAGACASVAFRGIIPYLLGSKLANGFGGSSTAEEVAASWDGKGRTAIVTGCSSGIGAETVRVLAERGCHVIMAVRDIPKTEKVAAAIRAQHPDASLEVMLLDLSSLASVRDFAAAFLAGGQPLNILVQNAGVMACPFTKSVDGHELQFATNFLGPFLLNQLLLDKVIATAKDSGVQGRIVHVASTAIDMCYPGGIRFDKIDDPQGYTPWGAYGQSKVALVLLARELALRLRGQPVASVSCHPGGIPTELQRHVSPMLSKVVLAIFGRTWKSIPQGAATQVYLSTAPTVDSGEFYIDCNVSPAPPTTLDAAAGRRLWALGDEMVAAAQQK